MFKTLTATAAAAVLAITSFTATPAQAEMDRGETIRLLIGLGAIGALVAANERSKDRSRTATRYDNRVIDVTPNYGNDRGRYKDRGRHARLPERCETSVPTRRGTQIFYGAPCLQRNGFQARLPRACSYTLNVGRKQVQAYEQRCLRQNGFRT